MLLNFKKEHLKSVYLKVRRTRLERLLGGEITYLEYRYRVEFGFNEYKEIDAYCKKLGIDWFASCWDIPSIDFIEQFNPICFKVPSACLTNSEMLKYLSTKGVPIILSTGMSTLDEIDNAISFFSRGDLILLHSTSIYPAKPHQLNLRVIKTLKKKYNNILIGYSGHETGLQTTYAAIVLGACLVERHITIDRSMWGSDQPASLEPQGLQRLVRDIRVIEEAMGNGRKVVYDEERKVMQKLRYF